jgi:acetyl esterase/lipase
MILIQLFLSRFIKIIATVGSMQHSRNHSIGRKRSDPFILVPHLAPTGTEDGTLNALNRNIPVSVQHYMRDKGIMRFLADTSALLAATTLGATKPSILKKFLDTGKRMTCYMYGDAAGQNFEVFDFPENLSPSKGPTVLILVHGGAWGSGKPWMYRLMASGMAKSLDATSAIVLQYPLYPEAIISRQAESIYEAIRYIRWNSSKIGLPSDSTYVLSGHSSGANICALALLKCIQNEEKLVDSFIALNGVYDIEKHYHFEKARGAHEFSPMSVAAISPDRWWECSPSLLLQEVSAVSAAMFWPDTFILHGLTDTTVPFSSSHEFAESLIHKGVTVKTCFPKELAHADCIFEFTVDGASASADAVTKYYTDFLERQKQTASTISGKPRNPFTGTDVKLIDTQQANNIILRSNL